MAHTGNSTEHHNAHGAAQDPRVRPEMAQVLQSIGFGGFMAETHETFVNFYETLPNELPGDDAEEEVIPTTVAIDGQDGNRVNLYVWKKAGSGVEKKRPAIIYLHGGAMTVLNTRSRPTDRWCKSLALQGLVVVMVDFRNAWSPGEHNPFPAGLNDCASAVQYVHAHMSELGASKIVLEGESGGGNLVLATALKARREGWVNAIDGVFAHAPTISAAYDWPREKTQKELPSFVQNKGFFLDMHTMFRSQVWYTPNRKDWTNPLAWPYHASNDDLLGLPPHIICIDELDCLASEGQAYFQQLKEAGVKAELIINKGVVHCTHFIFRQALPGEHVKSVAALTRFAQSL